jgi:hypothetical protein
MHRVASTPDVVDYTIDQDGCGCTPPRQAGLAPWLAYFATGLALGVVFLKSEVVSWYRIQEMFRFESFHLFGIIGVAVIVAAATQHLLLGSGAKSLGGEPIAVAAKLRTPSNARYWLGGVVFGLGWALLGACPGPIFTLVGAGHTVYLVPLAAAAMGTYLYAAVKDRLPH